MAFSASDDFGDLQKKIAAFITARANGDEVFGLLLRSYGDAMLAALKRRGRPQRKVLLSSALWGPENGRIIPMSDDHLLGILGDAVQPIAANFRSLVARVWEWEQL